MKNIIWILLAIVILAGMANAQGWAWASGNGFAWNHTVTTGDTMVWDNSAVTLFYQIHPYVNSTGISDLVTEPPLSTSRFWTGSNNGTRRDSLGTIATTALDSSARVFVIANQTNYTWGGWMRFILTDGTHTSTSSPVRIGNKEGALTVFYYFDDVGTTKLNLWTLVQGK